MVLPNPTTTFKALLLDYDYLIGLSDDECCYSLSQREIQMLLAQIDYIAWKTRYIPTETEIDTNLIQRWSDNLARKLMSGCCPDDGRLSRYTENGIYQTSDDGGETWQDNPDADPRNNATQAPPLGGSGASTKCAAADNARDTFKSYRDQMISLLEAGTTVLAIVAGLIGALGILLGLSVVGLSVSVLLFGMAAALLALTPEEVAEQLSDTVMDDFRCILYCNVGDNGEFSYSAWQEVISDIDDTFTGFPERFFHSIVAAMGYIGLTNAGTIGAATADDCGDCDCPNPPCDDEMNWEVGTVTSNTFDPETGWRTYTINPEAFEGGYYIQWNNIASSLPDGCKIINFSFGGSPGAEQDFYYGLVGRSGGTFTGPVPSTSVPYGAEGECFNFFQINIDNNVPITVVFAHC